MQAAAGTMLVLCNMAVRQCEGFYCRQRQAQCWFCVIWQSGSVRRGLLQAAAGTMLVLCNMAVRQCEGFYCRRWQAQCWFCVIWQSGSVRRGFIAGSGRHNAGSV